MTFTIRPCGSFLDYVLLKVVRDRVFRAIKVRLNKCLNAFQKTICTKRICVSFLDCVFVKVFGDRVLRAIKVRLKKMSKRFSKNDLYKETLCFLSGSCLCQSISRSSVSCYQSSIEENVLTPFKKRFVLRDSVFTFWIISLSKSFEFECFVPSKID